jgi:hypothetical protein
VPSRRILNGYELATRLSFFLWNTTPDDELLDSAASGELASDAGVRAAANRLLGSPRAQVAVESFFRELLRLDDLDDLPQLPTVFPSMSATLGPAMRSETLKMVSDIVMTRDADYRELFDSKTTFVNDELAKLYGLPAPAGHDFAKATLPDSGMRAGFLGQASFLALNAHADSTSPTRRGKFIREVLLCQAIPPPPPNVDTTLPTDPPGTTPLTMRQKLEKHRSEATCATCHKVMDPIGLGLENFDGIGAYRATEAGLTIDASGDLDGTAFTNARELGTALKNHPAVSSCVARSVFRYAIGHIETIGEESVIQALSAKLSTDGFRFRSLLETAASSAGFRYTGNPE